MNAKTSTKTTKKTTVEVVKNTKEARKQLDKTLSLDDIENEMTAIALDETTDFVKLMLNEKRMAMLEKVANIKMHRLQLKALEQSNEPVDVKPLEVKFVNSKTEEQKARLERIENEVKESRHIRQDA